MPARVASPSAMREEVTALVRHFERIERQHMRGLPILNPSLSVEAVGFRAHGDHQLGVLITPWFMNLVLIAGSEEWSDVEQGSTIRLSLPAGHHDFTLSRDDELGTYMAAVLFRTVVDFPDQETARAVAADVLRRLYAEASEAGEPGRAGARPMSRRDLFRRLGAG